MKMLPCYLLIHFSVEQFLKFSPSALTGSYLTQYISQEFKIRQSLVSSLLLQAFYLILLYFLFPECQFQYNFLKASAINFNSVPAKACPSNARLNHNVRTIENERENQAKKINLFGQLQKMGGKKSDKKREGQEEEGSESNDSSIQREMEQFNSNEPWQQLDILEQNLFNGIYEASSPEDMSKPPKKRDRRKQRQQQIAEYQQALRIAEKQNNVFVNPFDKYDLNVDIEQYRKMLHDVVDGTRPPQGVARILGFKSLRILHNERLYMQFNLAKNFLEELKVPDWIKQAHTQLITEQDQKKP